MLIAVQYKDGRFDMVKERLLDQLISEREISLFRRRNGWTTIERGRVRGELSSASPYKGSERRSVPD
jgi:hypothetical protein